MDELVAKLVPDFHCQQEEPKEAPHVYVPPPKRKEEQIQKETPQPVEEDGIKNDQPMVVFQKHISSNPNSYKLMQL